MIRTDYTVEDLKKLPIRAIVAFAARCARRVEDLSQLPEGHPERENRRAAVDAAIRIAEEVSIGSADTPVELAVQAVDASRSVAGGGIGCECAVAAVAATAHAAATAWLALNPGPSDQGPKRWTNTAEARSFLGRLANFTADLAALDAFTAAVEASNAVARDDAFFSGAVRDYKRLLDLHLGSYPQAGQPIDPSPDGPLGPL
jgi:hypothetical protein